MSTLAKEDGRTNEKVQVHDILKCNICMSPLHLKYERWRCPYNCNKAVTYIPAAHKGIIKLESTRPFDLVAKDKLVVYPYIVKFKQLLVDLLRFALTNSPYIHCERELKDVKGPLRFEQGARELQFRSAIENVHLQSILAGEINSLEHIVRILYLIGYKISVIEVRQLPEPGPQLHGINLDVGNTHEE